MKNPNTEVASVSDRNWSHEFSDNKLTHCEKYHRKSKSPKQYLLNAKMPLPRKTVRH